MTGGGDGAVSDQGWAEAAPSGHALNARPLPHGIAADNLAALPAAPGVYLFFGASTAASDPGELPLYIGKSINIRTRVLSHLRTPAEARMLAQSRRVDWVRTAGEVGALLLESRLIKTRQPLFNQRLRRARQLCAWQVTADADCAGPRLRFSRELDFASAPDLFGLYSSPTQAKAALLTLAQAHGLCLATLGLEPVARRACFARQLGRCAGACVGLETPQAHQQRLRAALAEQAVQRWPFDGAMGLVERDGDWTQTHVIERWRHLGTLDSGSPQGGAGAGTGPTTVPQAPSFDVDAYRILVKPLLSGQGTWLPMPSGGLV